MALKTLYCTFVAPQKEAKAHKVPMEGLTNRWTVIGVDMRAVARELTSSPYNSLTSLQFCSTMTVRGAFTSDLKFSFGSWPTEMALSHAVDPAQFDWMWTPAEPTDVQEPTVKVPKPVIYEKLPRTAATNTATDPEIAIPPPPDAATRRARVALPPSELDGVKPSRAPLLRPDPFLKLERVTGFTGEFSRVLRWVPNREELLFSAASALVAMSSESYRFACGMILRCACVSVIICC